MRIATFNVNGIRASVRRGFTDWLLARECDLVALQEVSSPADLVPAEASTGDPSAYHPGDPAGRQVGAPPSRPPPERVTCCAIDPPAACATGQPRRAAARPDAPDPACRR